MYNVLCNILYLSQKVFNNQEKVLSYMGYIWVRVWEVNVLKCRGWMWGGGCRGVDAIRCGRVGV